MRQSRLADQFPSLRETTDWVAVSGGSLVMAPHVGEEFVYGEPPFDSDRAMGIVAHVDQPDILPDHSMANASARVRHRRSNRYKVVAGAGEVICEGRWKLFAP